MSTVGTTQVYHVYVKATPQAIWDAIVRPDITERYGYGVRYEYEVRPGTTYRGTELVGSAPEPELMVDGEILEVDEPRKLVQTWRMLMSPAMASEGFTRVTWELHEGKDGVTKLTLTHDLEDAPTVALLASGALEDQGVGGGWSWVLSGLKTLLETGAPLGPPGPNQL
jgi:uncharacterized protein YndB with AHSA1/START domain